MIFTVTNRITDTYQLSGILFFLCIFNKEPIQWNSFASFWVHCGEVTLHRQTDSSFTLPQPCSSRAFLQNFSFSHIFTHFPNLICSEGFLSFSADEISSITFYYWERITHNATARGWRSHCLNCDHVTFGIRFYSYCKNSCLSN